MLSNGRLLDGKYEVIRTLGQGGMSTVYLCRNKRLDNYWAIKEVKKTMKGQMDLLAEPNILKNLNHPGIPRVVDIFYEEENLYIVEDYIKGETLEDYINNNDVKEAEQICMIALSICEIIGYLHSFNPPIIYRDLKPSNIMISPDGKVVLIDFGISRIYKQGGDKDTIYLGSKGYAAPEQYGTEQTCRQTDIYSLGAVMYFMITRKTPSVLFEPLKDKNYSTKIKLELKTIIQKSMQIDIESRYSSIEEMKKAILKFLNSEEDTRTLVMNNEVNYTNSLFVNNNKGEKSILGSLLIDKDNEVNTVNTNRSQIKNLFNGQDKKDFVEDKAETKVTSREGKINFVKIEPGSEGRQGSNKKPEETKLKSNKMKLDMIKNQLKVNISRLGNIKGLLKLGIIKLNRIKITVAQILKKSLCKIAKDNENNKYKVVNKLKISLVKKFVTVAICVLVVILLGYLVNANEKKDQIINTNQTTKGDEINKLIDNGNTTENKTEVVPTTKEPLENKLSESNNPTGDTSKIQENSGVTEYNNEGDKEDKKSKDKKETKGKGNGKAKGKNKDN